MKKKKYLFIVEKSIVQRWLGDAFAKIQDNITYDVDFAVSNNHIIDLSNEIFQRLSNLDDLKAMSSPQFKKKTVEPYFKIDQDGFWKTNGEKILELINNNEYDAIVNACDPDEAGNLIFQYMVESLDLESFPAKRFVYFDLTDKHLTQAFLAFDENENE